MKTKNYIKFVLKFGVFVIVFFNASIPLARATDYTSTTFILRDPIITVEGERSTSTSFELYSTTGETVVGQTTATGFTHHAGFLFFPVATTPVVTSTAGDARVSFTWTAATGSLGNVTDYRLATATTSGGPYTYESIGTSLSFTKTGLTNGTAYYFRIEAQAATEVVARSVEISAAPAASVSPPPPSSSSSSGGGGSGGGNSSPVSSPQQVNTITFSGRAFPKSTVTLLKDAQVAATTVAGQDANFTMSLTGLSAGNYILSVYGEDKEGRRSSLLTFPTSVSSGTAATVSGIFIAPTIAVDKIEVKRGDNIAIFGQSVPNGEVTITVNSSEEFFGKVQADDAGVYLYNFDTTPLNPGRHTTKAKAAGKNEVSSFSTAVAFKVGKKNIQMSASDKKQQDKKKYPAGCPRADLNCDGRVNLVDFSIAAFWYKRPLIGVFKEIEHGRLNGDKKIDLKDFSIMAYHWTG